MSEEETKIAARCEFEKATERLTEEKAALLRERLTFYEKTVLEPVTDQMLEFCRTSEEFSSACLAEGKSLKGCLAAALEDIRRDASDDAVYTRAARYYAPGCAVNHTRTLDMHPGRAKKAKILSWTDLL